MAIKIIKKGPPKPKPTAADSARAVQIKKRNTDVNSSLGVVSVYKKNYPGKDPAGLAARNAPPRPGNPTTKEESVQMRMVRDTTMSNALGQAMRERTNKAAGVPIRIKRKSGTQ